MIEDYFLRVEGVLREFPSIRSRVLTQKVYNDFQGYISGRIEFENRHSLEFTEVVDTEQTAKIKYRYQYMDEKQSLIFRYDNVPHHKEVKSFPHHKHLSKTVADSKEPNLNDVLLEIARLQRKKKK
jgi:hypothetical protein